MYNYSLSGLREIKDGADGETTGSLLNFMTTLALMPGNNALYQERRARFRERCVEKQEVFFV